MQIAFIAFQEQMQRTQATIIQYSEKDETTKVSTCQSYDG